MSVYPLRNENEVEYVHNLLNEPRVFVDEKLLAHRHECFLNVEEVAELAKDVFDLQLGGFAEE